MLKHVPAFGSNDDVLAAGAGVLPSVCAVCTPELVAQARCRPSPPPRSSHPIQWSVGVQARQIASTLPKLALVSRH